MSAISAIKTSPAAAPTMIPMLVGGESRAAAETYEVRDPYRGEVVARAPRSARVDLDAALDAAVAARAKAAATPAYERAALLRRAGTLLVERAATTDVGTLIDERAAQRVESWIAEAKSSGARVLTGGKRHGAAIEPTVIADAKPAMKVVCDEVFGPVVSLLPYHDVDEVFSTISAGRFGLQTGIFTTSTELAIRAARSLRTGGVIINGSSTWRTDQLAYGGVKESGIGREGPRYSIRDMTEERIVLFNY